MAILLTIGARVVANLRLFNFLRSIYESFKLFKKHKPSLTIGFGGYVSVGASITSFLLSIPRPASEA